MFCQQANDAQVEIRSNRYRGMFLKTFPKRNIFNNILFCAEGRDYSTGHEQHIHNIDLSSIKY